MKLSRDNCASISAVDKSPRSTSETPSNTEGSRNPLIPLQYGPHQMKVLCPYCNGQVTTSVEYSAGEYLWHRNSKSKTFDLHLTATVVTGCSCESREFHENASLDTRCVQLI